jgi:hypothetical protein
MDNRLVVLSDAQERGKKRREEGIAINKLAEGFLTANILLVISYCIFTKMVL